MIKITDSFTLEIEFEDLIWKTSNQYFDWDTMRGVDLELVADNRKDHPCDVDVMGQQMRAVDALFRHEDFKYVSVSVTAERTCDTGKSLIDFRVNAHVDFTDKMLLELRGKK